MRTRVLGVVALVAGLFLLGAPTHAATAPPAVRSHSSLLQFADPQQSNNWSGYNQGSIEKNVPGGFHQISGDWNVPTAKPHTEGESEYSSTWIGIGGGCEDLDCNNQDQTLIQTGTEQDVIYDPLTGETTTEYSAWWELIPDTGQTIDGSQYPVSPGDHMHASIVENGTGSGNWTITLQDVTENWTFTNTVDYTSNYGSAEFIEETPVVVAIYPPSIGFAPLPALSTTTFSNAIVNNAPAGLTVAEQMQLVDLFNNVEATPSAPDAAATSFNICSYTTTCAAPTSGTSSTGHPKKH